MRIIVQAGPVLFGLLICFLSISHGQSKEIPIALIPIEGSQAASANQILAHEISRSGFFYLAKPEPGAFLVKGRFTNKGLEGEMLHPDGHKLFERKYTAGDLTRDVRQFADDIVLAATGRPGIATSQIAFVGHQGGKPDIYVCDYDGKNIRQITRDGLPKRYPCLSSNGSELFFTGMGSGENTGIFKIDLAKAKQSRIADIHGAGTERALISPDGKRLVIALSPDGNSDLYISRSSGKFRKRLTDSPAVEIQPSWSPDGKSLVYTVVTANGSTQLFVIDSKNGNRPSPLSIPLPNPSQPSWSPDGNRIAFVSESANKKSLAIHDLRNRSTKSLTTGQSPAWGADSRHLIYTVGGNLYRIDVDSGKKAAVLTGGGQIYDPSWTR